MDLLSAEKQILVTGGAGFIGSHLVDRLLREGFKVICLDNFNDFYAPRIKRKNIDRHLSDQNFMLIEGDVRDRSLAGELFSNHRISIIVHLAARAGVRPSVEQPFLYEDVNVKGTLNLLECARNYQIENFIFGSSSSVYGLNPKVPFSEDDKVDFPISPYATTKKAAELFCRTYHHLYSIPITCLRFFTVYGPRQRPDMAIHKFTRLIYEDREIPVYGDGKSSRDYTYIGDIIEGIISVLERRNEFEIINLGNCFTIELEDLIILIEKNIGKKARVKWLPNQAGDVPTTCADISKAKELLGYNPRVNIEEGIRKFVEWFKLHEE